MISTYCCLFLIQQGLFPSPFWSVLIFLLCKVYFLLWNGCFLWIAVLPDMLVQVPLSCWIKTFNGWNIWNDLRLWKSSFGFKQNKCELFRWCTFLALCYTWILGIVEKVMVVSNMFQWLKEFLQVRLPLIKYYWVFRIIQYVEHCDHFCLTFALLQLPV